MCLIIHSPKGKTPKIDILKSAMQYNPDGVGIMHGGNIVEKWITISPDKLHARLQEIKEAWSLHFRMATHGDVNVFNIHPYSSRHGYLMHNGILSMGNRWNVKKSDTFHYIDRILNRYKTLDINKVKQDIGQNNKFVIMTRDNSHVIVNETSGYWIKGLWFSNLYSWDSITDQSKSFSGFGVSYRERYNSLRDSIDSYMGSLGIDTWELQDSELMAKLEELSTPYNYDDVDYSPGFRFYDESKDIHG